MIDPLQNNFLIELNRLPSRQRTIQSIAHRIDGGLGIALIAEPRMGKTGLLEYLISPENIESLYGERGKKYVFSLINCQMLPHEYSLAQFWGQVLSTISETVEQSGSNLLLKRYVLCKNSKYQPFELEAFFRQLKKLDYRLIMMLDEFDALITHPILASSEFFGILRGVSISSGLTTLIATRQSLESLNESLYRFDNTGSPYLNFFMPVRLAVLSLRDVAEILNDKNYRLSQTDKQFISDVSGGHPFILQVATASLLNLSKGYTEDNIQRYLIAGRKVYESTQLHYRDLWHFWSVHTRKAIVAVALLQAPHMLAIKDFHQGAIKASLPYLAPELDELVRSGIIASDKIFESGYKISQGSLLWWLADELLRTIRGDNTFEAWLMEKQMVGGIVSQKELDSLKILVKSVGGFLDKGATSLIEAYAKSIVVK